MDTIMQFIFGAALGFAFVRLMRRRARQEDYRRQVDVRLAEVTE